MKKSFKKLLASLLVAIMVLSVSPVGALTEIDLSSLFSVEASALTSGSYTYTVSGKNATITAYSGTASSLSIPSTINGYTVIGIDPGAFANNQYIKTLYIPSTVVKIGQVNQNFTGAFENCIKLSSVTIYEGNKDAMIGGETFKNCTSLQSIVIPGNYTTIYEDAFYGCTSLNSMTLEESNYTYANQVIEAEVFKGCSALETVSLPTTLKSIGSNAFNGCAIVNLTVPEGVTIISEGAFTKNTYLKTVSIPSTVTTIGQVNQNFTGAFEGCTKLQTVTISSGSKDATIGGESFKNCTSLQSIVIPGNYTTIYEDAFYGCTSLKSMTLKKSNYTYANQMIDDEAFRGCSALETVSLPTTLKSIGSNAFNGCAIVNLTVPEGVTIISEGAFAKNTYLKTVSIPSTVTTIGQVNQNFTGAFEGCTKLQTVTISSGSKDATIGGESFKNCTSLQSIVIPGNYTTIYEDAFYGCTSLKSMTLKKSNYTYANQMIDDEAFRGCSALETVSLPTTLNSIGSHTFNGCAIVNLTVPEGVTTVADGAFTNNVNLKTVSLPKTLTSIGATSTGFTGVFENCTNLKSVIFGEGNKDLIIGSETFKKCANLTTVHLPLNLVEIKEQAFDGSKANLTICSKSNSSYGKTYADSNSIKFKLCNGTHTSTPTTTYTVTYNANGGSISPTTVSVTAGQSVNLPIPSKSYKITYNANGGSGAPSAQSFAVTCKGWSTSSSATSASYYCGSKYTPTKNVTLYAVWSDSADGVISTQKPTRSGYKFLGWETSSTATSARFKGGEDVTLTGGNVTLYAIWEKDSTPAVNPTLWCSQTYLRLDTEYVDTGMAKITINNWGDKEITLSLWTSDKSVVSGYFGEFEGNSIVLYVEAKKVGDCELTIKLYNSDETVKYDEKTIRVSVKGDPFEHISLNYKDTYKLNPEGFEIMVADSDSNAVSVDNNGRLNANAEGDAVVMLIDADGNVRYYEVTVSYAWWQWIIIIVLFGWIWY